MMGDTSTKKDILIRLRRIEGQIRGIYKMINEGQECRRVLQQVSAVRSALRKVGILYIVSDIEKCFEKDTDPERMIGEFRKLVKSLSVLL